MRQVLQNLVPNVYRFALRLTGDPHAAEDLTQETFLRAWRKRRRLKEPEAARVYLFRIAHNLHRDGLRRAKVRDGAELPVRDVREADGLEVREEARRAMKLLDALPRLQREALYLQVCEGLAIADIAGVLETSPASVKASVSLARKKLREQMEAGLAGPAREVRIHES